MTKDEARCIRERQGVFAELTRPILCRPGDVIRTPPKPKIVRRQHNGRPPKLKVPDIYNPWGLTPSQCAVLACCAEGLSDKQIAAHLLIGQSALDIHHRKARQAMGGVSRVRAAVLWDRHARDAA